MATNPYLGKNLDELFELLETQQPGQIGHEQLKMVIFSHFLHSIESSISGHRMAVEEMSKSNDKLGHKIFYLNLALTIATIAGSVIAYFQLTG